jgi:hypothetical protein
VAAGTGIGVLSSATFATTILTGHVKRYRERVARATPVGASVNSYWGNNVHAFCGEDNDAARKLAALSLKTFFGPDKPYIRDRVNAYEQLLESWGGVPDHLKADFGRWLRQADDAHKAQAEQVGISLDSGPGAARVAFGQMDPDSLRARVIAAGDPSRIRGAPARGGRVDEAILITRWRPSSTSRPCAPSRCSQRAILAAQRRQAHARRSIEDFEPRDDRRGGAREESDRGATACWGALSRPGLGPLRPPSNQTAGADECPAQNGCSCLISRRRRCSAHG